MKSRALAAARSRRPKSCATGEGEGKILQRATRIAQLAANWPPGEVLTDYDVGNNTRTAREHLPGAALFA